MHSSRMRTDRRQWPPLDVSTMGGCLNPGEGLLLAGVCLRGGEGCLPTRGSA